MTELNEAAARRDRAALERIIAPAFIGVHAMGYVEDRETWLDDILTRLPEASFRFPPFSFDAPNELIVLGDLALHRIRVPALSGQPAILTITYSRRDGRWQVLQTNGTELQPERPTVTLPRETLEAFAGRYRWPNGAVDTITLEGKGLAARVDTPRLGKRRLTPASETEFWDTGGAQWTFHRDAAGKVTHFVWRRQGTESRADRVQ